MSLKLMKPIAAFFAAKDGDEVEALGQYFSDRAVVHDEGRTMEGLASIREWRKETKKKYGHTIEPLASVQKDGKIVVTSRVTGNFPGSPIDLQFIFSVESGRIVSLEIH